MNQAKEIISLFNEFLFLDDKRGDFLNLSFMSIGTCLLSFLLDLGVLVLPIQMTLLVTGFWSGIRAYKIGKQEKNVWQDIHDIVMEFEEIKDGGKRDINQDKARIVSSEDKIEVRTIAPVNHTMNDDINKNYSRKRKK